MPKADPNTPTGPYQNVVLAPASGFKARWLAIAFTVGASIGGGVGATVRGHSRTQDIARDEESRQAVSKTGTGAPNVPDVQRVRGQLLREIHRARQHGVLIIEDGRAKTAKDNVPALGSNRGFTKLEHGEYPIQTYAVEQDEAFGIGVAGDPTTMSFLFLWQQGSAPPPRDPHTLELATGRRVIAKED